VGCGFCDGIGKIVSQNKQFVLTLNRFFLWLQLYADATGNFVRCLQLSKLKLGLELKQKFAPKQRFLNNPTQLCKCEKGYSYTIVEFEGLVWIGWQCAGFLF